MCVCAESSCCESTWEEGDTCREQPGHRQRCYHAGLLLVSSTLSPVFGCLSSGLHALSVLLQVSKWHSVMHCCAWLHLLKSCHGVMVCMLALLTALLSIWLLVLFVCLSPWQMNLMYCYEGFATLTKLQHDQLVCVATHIGPSC